MSTDNKHNRVTRKITQELKRGNLTLAVLSQLQETHYGYSLITKLQNSGLEISQDTLYPLLRRLEDHGILKSSWKVEGSRPRKYYIMSTEGQKIFKELREDWIRQTSIIKEML